MQMLLRGVEVAGGVFQVSMTEQDLNGTQVGAGFEQMGCPTMAQSVGGNPFGDLGSACGVIASDPNRLVGNGLLWSASAPPGEQIQLGLPPTPVLAQGFQQRRAERKITILASLALHHADNHAVTIDV